MPDTYQNDPTCWNCGVRGEEFATRWWICRQPGCEVQWKWPFPNYDPEKEAHYRDQREALIANDYQVKMIDFTKEGAPSCPA